MWVDAINMQSLSGHFFKRQRYPWCFYFIKCISVLLLAFLKNKVGSMLAQGFLRVKGQAKITKCYSLWVGTINMQSLSGHYLIRQQVSMVFVLLLVYLGAVAHISVEISFKLGLMLAQGYLKGQRSSIIHKLQLFITLCDMQSSSGNQLW